MSSILKVDQIQLADGSTPTVGDLGLNTTGSVLQAKKFTLTNSGTVNCGNSWTNVLSGSITPSSSTSKFIIQGHAMISNAGGGGLEMGIRIVSDIGGTIDDDILRGDTDGSRLRCLLGNQIQDASYNSWTPSFTVFDEPNTTSEITYRLKYFGSESQNAYYNRVPGGADANYVTRGTTAFVVMEIAG